MKKILKFLLEKKVYFIVSFITLISVSIIYTLKGVFPFGLNTILFNDAGEEVVTMYYHLWDSVRGSSSLLIDWSSGGGVNFFAAFGYYISSPLSFLCLLVPRVFIVHFTSIIVLVKILLGSITILYMLNIFFKNMDVRYKISLSILYVFVFSLPLLHTGFLLDSIYLFPLLVVGLKKLLDLGDTKQYIIVLTISLICLARILPAILIYIMVISIIYICFYKAKKEKKKILINLLLATLTSVLLASFIIVPTYAKIISSSYLASNSMVDKIIPFLNFGIVSGVYILYMLDKTNRGKDKSFINSILCLFVLFIMVPSISKFLMLGTSMNFMLLPLIILAGKYFNGLQVADSSKKNRIIAILITVFGSAIMITVMLLFGSNVLQNYKALWTIGLVFVISALVIVLIFKLNKNNKYASYLFLFMVLINVFIVSSVYIKDNNGNLENEYKTMISLSKEKNVKDNFNVKNDVTDMMSNFGRVSTYNTFSIYDDFISKETRNIMKKFGYDYYGNSIYTSGGNLFIDTVLAQKYLLTDNKISSKDDYYKKAQSLGNLNFYVMKNSMSYGYLLDKIPDITKAKNSFEISNIIYNSITGKDDLFEHNSKFDPKNVDAKMGTDNVIKLTKESDNAYLEKNVLVMDKKAVYLEINYDKELDEDFFDTFEISVAGRVIDADYTFPNEYHNGTVYLGTYTNELIQVKVKLLKDTRIKDITMAYLDLEKYDDFVSNYKHSSKITFDNNKINIEVNSDEEKILFLPINYLDGYTLLNNGKKDKVLKVYDNFIGVKLNKGENEIVLTYVPEGLSMGASFTLIGMVLFLIQIKYNKK